MRVFIISDMEGVSGIVRWKQVTGGEHHLDAVDRQSNAVALVNQRW